ncbi:DUF3429 domain-containing protein [Alloalcanivorax mobilis]|uniref:DUF3429 domain-containing protein n=1 Tax=Alloalcanivorax mobilis TaxID=2019569 RepID=UPI000C77A97E|nr:DUF3429 domain-containing protein [Alloalcanivorax mobilis]
MSEDRFTHRNILTARLLGVAGLIPFYALAALAWRDDLRPWALHAEAGYAAVVLSFLGAVHWGRALASPTPRNHIGSLLFGIKPALLGWFALMLPVEFALPMLTAGLVFVWGTEQMVFFETLPTWYRHLRHLLTAGAAFALLIAWAAAMTPMF